MGGEVVTFAVDAGAEGAATNTTMVDHWSGVSAGIRVTIGGT